MRCLTQYWKNSTWRSVSAQDGKPLTYTAGNALRTVNEGDVLYIITNLQGKLYLCGRIRAERVLSREEAEELLGGEVWDAKWHVVCGEKTADAERYNREIPSAIASELSFDVGGEHRRLVMRDDGVDRQTVRGLRELTPESAAALDQLIGKGNSEPGRELASPCAGSGPAMEGRARLTRHLVRERNRSLVQAKKASAGADPHCVVCGLSFEAVYGDLGRSFIECHHVDPLSKRSRPTKTSPDDLALVCANCHRMLHRALEGELSMTPERLRQIVRERRGGEMPGGAQQSDAPCAGPSNSKRDNAAAAASSEPRIAEQGARK